ncbi:hypothetical protein KBB27_02135 [Patescibacteria group bacterium]|nr:hypothetical protein [Patescibacteria group bacterium]
MKNNSQKILLPVVAVILLVATFAFGKYFARPSRVIVETQKTYTNTTLNVSLIYPSTYDDVSSSRESSGFIGFGIKGVQDLSGFGVTVTSTSFATTADWINAQPKGSPSRPGFEPVLWLDDAPNGKAILAEYIVVDQDGKKPIYGRVLSGVLVRNGKLFKVTFRNQSLATGAPTIPADMMSVFESLQWVN